MSLKKHASLGGPGVISGVIKRLASLGEPELISGVDQKGC